MKNRKVLIGLSMFVALSLVVTFVLVLQKDTGIYIPDDGIPEGVAVEDGTISVHDFGAVGDGVTDDTAAIKKAIEVASQNNLVLTFRDVFSTYLVTSTIWVPSNTKIDGHGATLYMPPQTEVTTLLYTNRRNYTESIEIRNLNLDSELSIVGTSRLEVGVMTSNVQAIFFSGVSDVIIDNVRITDMSNGIKFGTQADKITNKNILINNVEVTNTLNDLYADMTDGLTVTNTLLDASGGVDQRLHNAYISGGSSNIVFDTVEFRNSPGAGINLYNAYSDKEATSGVTVLNSTFTDLKVGINLWKGTNDVLIENSTFIRNSMALSLNTAESVEIKHVTIQEADTWSVDKGGMMFRDSSNVLVEDSYINATGMEGFVFLFFENNTDIQLNNVMATNLEGIYGIYANKSNLSGSLSNSIFQWDSVGRYGFGLYGENNTFTLDDNLFFNSGATANYLSGLASSNVLTYNRNQVTGFNAVGTGSGIVESETLYVDAVTATAVLDNNLLAGANLVEGEALVDETEEALTVSPQVVETDVSDGVLNTEEVVEDEAIPEGINETTDQEEQAYDIRLEVTSDISQDQNGPNWLIGGQVLVSVYNKGLSVADAQVIGHWDGAAVYTESDTTNADGVANFSMKPIRLEAESELSFVVTELVIDGQTLIME